jgi:hypothetical protein
MGEIKNACRIFGGKLFGGWRRCWKNDVKMYLRGVSCEDGRWMGTN